MTEQYSKSISKYIDDLIRLEPIFIKAGELALKMQKNIKSDSKSNSGVHFFDIVTKADLAVQEYILKELAKTSLVECRLLAEENTPSVNKFSPKSDIYLTLDPINGTSIYAEGKESFDLIVTLHDGEEMLYTFDFFPAFKWQNRLTTKYESKGRPPIINLPKDSEKTVVQKFTSDYKSLGEKFHSELTKSGYIFKKATDLYQDIVTDSVLLTKSVAGIYVQNPVVYDGLVGLHLAKTNNYKVFKSDDFSLKEYDRGSKDQPAKHPGSY